MEKSWCTFLRFLTFSLPNSYLKAIAQPPRPTKAQSVEDDEDAELAQLKAEMAM